MANKNLKLAIKVVSVLVVIWAVAYAIPEMVVTLFNTWIGNAVLVGAVVLSSMYDLHIGVILAISLVVLWRASKIEHFII